MRSIGLLLAIYFCVLLSVFAQNSKDAQGKKTGSWIENHSNGKPRYKGSFESGQPTGKFEFYDDLGQLLSVTQYKDSGKAHAQFFFPTGELKGQGAYVHKKKQGIWKFYNKQQQLIASENYNNDVKIGTHYLFYGHGDTLECQRYNNGVKEGLWTKYYPKGVLMLEEYYSGDELEGKATYYFPSGKIKSTGLYHQGLKNDTWSYYNSEGIISFKEKYVHGRCEMTTHMNGVFEEYFEDGQIVKASHTYKNGKLHGDFKEYFPGATWELVEQTYDQEEFPGRPNEWVQELVGHHLKREGSYFEGKLNGIVKLYDIQGILIATERYVAGQKMENKQ